MGRYSNEQINNILLTKNMKLIDATGYQNKSSLIMASCSKGHVFKVSLLDIEKPGFQCPSCMSTRLATSAATGEIPEKKGYRIMSLDQSSQTTGISIWENGQLIFYEAIKLVGELEDRLVKWEKWLNETLDKVNPDFVIYEDIQYQATAGVVSFKILAMIYGITTQVLQKRKIPHNSVLPTVWKSKANVNGTNRIAQKNNSKERVKEYFGVDVIDDISDSILIGWYQVQQSFDKWGEKKIF